MAVIANPVMFSAGARRRRPVLSLKHKTRISHLGDLVCLTLDLIDPTLTLNLGIADDGFDYSLVPRRGLSARSPPDLGGGGWPSRVLRAGRRRLLGCGWGRRLF